LRQLRDVLDVLTATWRRYTADRMMDGAAALSFYALFSLIPSLLIFAVVMRLLGRDAADDVAAFARDRGASTSLTAGIRSMLRTATDTAPEGAGAIGLTGLAALVYGTSKVFTSAGRQLDVVAGREVLTRPLPRRARDVACSVLLLVLVLVLLTLVFVTGNLVSTLLGAVGLSGVWALGWDLARWPAAGALAMVTVATVVWAAPTERPRAFRPATAGTLFTVGTFLAASAGYGFYVGHITDYNATYGAFAAVVILMIWVWIASTAFLFGAELVAELDGRRGR
jgi:membrane protein